MVERLMKFADDALGAGADDFSLSLLARTLLLPLSLEIRLTRHDRSQPTLLLSVTSHSLSLSLCLSLTLQYKLMII